MEHKGITNQLFALSTQSIKEEVPEIESKDAAKQLSPPLSSIKIKHEVDPKSLECEIENDSKDISSYRIEDTYIKTEPMFLPFVYDTKEHLKVDSMLEDDNSDNVLKASDIVFTGTNVTETTTSGFDHVKTEKYPGDGVGPIARYETGSDTTGPIEQSGSSSTKEQMDVSEVDNILPRHLETKLLETAGISLLGEVDQSKRTLITHNSKEKSYQCDICQKSFPQMGYMRRHQLTHIDEKPFQCNICEKLFSRKRNSITHNCSVHIDVRPYQCEICQNSFSHKGSLNSHKLTHMKEKPYKCDICEKSFSQKSSLNKHHQSIHSKARQYQCDNCHKSFSQKQNMLRHKLTHTTEKPFPCDICEKSFSRKDSLNTHHQSVHSKVRPYQCEICQKSFSLRGYLMRHKLTHTERETFSV